MKEVKRGNKKRLRYFVDEGGRRTHLTSRRQVDAAAKTVQKETVRKEVVKTARRLAEMLKTARHNGGYFDRTEEEGERLCTRAGWFTCQVSRVNQTPCSNQLDRLLNASFTPSPSAPSSCSSFSSSSTSFFFFLLHLHLLFLPSPPPSSTSFFFLFLLIFLHLFFLPSSPPRPPPSSSSSFSSSSFSLLLLWPHQGSFEQEACPSLHSINPYGSRESRIVFSTWNLDHRSDLVY